MTTVRDVGIGKVVRTPEGRDRYLLPELRRAAKEFYQTNKQLRSLVEDLKDTLRKADSGG